MGKICIWKIINKLYFLRYYIEAVFYEAGGFDYLYVSVFIFHTPFMHQQSGAVKKEIQKIETFSTSLPEIQVNCWSTIIIV